MSQVIHDAKRICHHEDKHGERFGRAEKKTPRDKQKRRASNISGNNAAGILKDIVDINIRERNDADKKKTIIAKHRQISNNVSERNSTDELNKTVTITSLDIGFCSDKSRKNDVISNNSRTVDKHIKKKNTGEDQREISLGTKVKKSNYKREINNDNELGIVRYKKIWQRQNITLWKKNNANTALIKRTKEKFKGRQRWGLNATVLISMVMLNVAGMSSAVDTSSFTSALTSRMIASFLGYPTTCSLGAEVRPCTLTFTCWLRGGTRLRGCGGWLFSCCGPPEPSRELDNSISSSEWKYKVSPPKLRQVPQRSVVPNNVFRRRVDDDLSQMDCGLPSSRILQKRIIGGREARFAEFPWQAHVRISEFQCGGVLVSRWFVATAAHCVSRAHTRDIAVWLGAIDTSATHHPARKLGVVHKILHPLFQFRMTQPDRYDIALLKLSRPITYTAHIMPICLPDYELDLRGRAGVIAGWGKTDASNSHTGTNMLRSATVPILSKDQCINWHQSKQISVEIHSEMICAGHSDGHQDACLGDSGGPLIVLDNGRYYLVGITSAGFGCGVDHQPGIYHNVKVTANWIRGVISPSVNYIDV